MSPIPLPPQGSSTDASTVATIKALAAKAKSVMVLLDSGHHADFVLQEMVGLASPACLSLMCQLAEFEASKGWIAASQLLFLVQGGGGGVGGWT